jgi:hypothetical protein
MPSAGTWQPLATTNPASGPTNTQVALLLSDGTLMVQPGSAIATNSWYRLTPDATGSYVTGTWSALASMNEQRYNFSTALLPDGRVFVLGGETSSPDPFTNTAEIFDPTGGANGSWKSVASVPTPRTNIDLPPGKSASQWGEDPIEVLPTGRVLAGYFNDPTVYLYDPSANTWTPLPNKKLRQDSTAEEAWVKLPDNSILSYDVHSSLSSGVFHAQRYIPSMHQWTDASNVNATNPPQVLNSTTISDGDVSGFLLPDRRVMFFGADGATAFYTPSTNIWTAGPSQPTVMINGVVTPTVATDNPGAVLPNGDILIALSPLGGRVNGHYTYPSPTYVYEFNPITQTFTDVTPPGLTNENCNYVNMLVLPTGQVLLTNQFGQMQVYTPSGSPRSFWRPTVQNVQSNGGGSFTLSGTQLNGISEGAVFGDDWQTASNYPIVQLTNSSGQVFYARTFGWSGTGVAFNTPGTVNFKLASGLPTGNYSLSVIANGIPSSPIAFVVTAGAKVSAQTFNNNGTGLQALGAPSVADQSSLVSQRTGLRGGQLSTLDVGRLTSTVAASAFTRSTTMEALDRTPARDGDHGVALGAALTRLRQRLQDSGVLDDWL